MMKHEKQYKLIEYFHIFSVQVNIAAESGDMGILSSHVPSIEQLRPGLIEIIEEGGQTKKFFRMIYPFHPTLARFP